MTPDLHRYLLSNGYPLFRRIQWENGYVPRDCERRAPLLGRLRLLRKMVLGTPLRAWKFERERAWLGKMERPVIQKTAQPGRRQGVDLPE